MTRFRAVYILIYSLTSERFCLSLLSKIDGILHITTTSFVNICTSINFSTFIEKTFKVSNFLFKLELVPFCITREFKLKLKQSNIKLKLFLSNSNSNCRRLYSQTSNSNSNPACFCVGFFP